MHDVMDGNLAATITHEPTGKIWRLVSDGTIVEIHTKADSIGVPLDTRVMTFGSELLVSFGGRICQIGNIGDTIDYDDGTSDLISHSNHYAYDC